MEVPKNRFFYIVFVFYLHISLIPTYPKYNWRARMQNQNFEVKFTCLMCQSTFEFDNVGENHFVPRPICGTNLFTVNRNRTLQLEFFEF